ncbi:MAG: transcriptional repressor LexA [Candidatus Latescibacterota bacterium]|jgi:repressor LexA|nr:MAG: transcriptional repressor LexA [Candidatus Latescibacterota bacterium]
MNGLTERQRRVLEFLRDYLRRHGYPPTIREIRTAFGLRSNRGVVDHLRALERKGSIRRLPGSSRAIAISLPDGENVDSAGKAKAYPVAGRVAAGRPEEAIEDGSETLLLDERLFGGKGDFVLEVKGDSMAGAHIVPGDLVVVRKTASCETGSLVVALVDGEATVKRYVRRGSRVVLEPANPAYSPIVLSGGSASASVLGTVVGVIRRYPGRGRAFSR